MLIRLPMPLTTDAQRVRDLILAACKAHEGVLETPAPSLTLEGIENGVADLPGDRLCGEPPAGGGVRSDLLFVILDELKKASLPLAVPTMVMTATAPEALATPSVPSSPASPIPGMPS